MESVSILGITPLGPAHPGPRVSGLQESWLSGGENDNVLSILFMVSLLFSFSKPLLLSSVVCIVSMKAPADFEVKKDYIGSRYLYSKKHSFVSVYHQIQYKPQEFLSPSTSVRDAQVTPPGIWNGLDWRALVKDLST